MLHVMRILYYPLEFVLFKVITIIIQGVVEIVNSNVGLFSIDQPCRAE